MEDALDSIDSIDPTRITAHEVPAALAEHSIIAGWNGNFGSFYVFVRWNKTMSHVATAGSMCYEAGHPVDSIATLPDLAAPLTQLVDWYHDDLVVVFFNLLTDQLIDGSSQHFAQNPYGNSHIPDLIGK